MTTDHDLESRLRAGLHAAADALPPASPTGSRTGPPSRSRLPLLVAAGVTVLALGGAGVVALGGGGNGDPDVMVSPPATDPPGDDAEATGSSFSAPGVDHPAGTAVATTSLEDDAVLTVYGPDGQPTSTVPLAPVTGAQTVVSDRQGGWIACGMGAIDPVELDADGQATRSGQTEPTTTVVPADPDDVDSSAAATDDEPVSAEPPEPNTYHFRPGQDPQPLPVDVVCTADAMGVTDLSGGQVLVYQSSFESLSMLDLATGDDEPVAIDPPDAHVDGWTVGGGRLALIGDVGLTLWDLTTGEQLTVGPVDLPTRPTEASTEAFASDLALSPDGTTLAALVGEAAETSDVVVVDLESGEELFRRTAPVSLEGAEVSFDGASVAVGNYYDSYGPVRIYDLTDGSERTIDAHGLVP